MAGGWAGTQNREADIRFSGQGCAGLEGADGQECLVTALLSYSLAFW